MCVGVCVCAVARWYRELLEYKALHHDCNVPKNWAPNPSLARWLSKQRAAKRKGLMAAHKEAKLDAIGVDWNPGCAEWEQMYAELCLYKERHGDCNVPKAWIGNTVGGSLGRWVQRQRLSRRKGLLVEERERQLNLLSFNWDGRQVRA